MLFLDFSFNLCIINFHHCANPDFTYISLSSLSLSPFPISNTPPSLSHSSLICNKILSQKQLYLSLTSPSLTLPYSFPLLCITISLYLSPSSLHLAIPNLSIHSLIISLILSFLYPSHSSISLNINIIAADPGAGIGLVCILVINKFNLSLGFTRH